MMVDAGFHEQDHMDLARQRLIEELHRKYEFVRKENKELKKQVDKMGKGPNSEVEALKMELAKAKIEIGHWQMKTKETGMLMNRILQLEEQLIKIKPTT